MYINSKYMYIHVNALGIGAKLIRLTHMHMHTLHYIHRGGGGGVPWDSLPP